MKFILKLTLVSLAMCLLAKALPAQTCSLPVKYASQELTQTERSLLSFVADANRLVFDIDAVRYTNTTATLSVFVNGTLVKGVAVKKGNFNTYFALDNLNGKHVEIKGHKASSIDKREIKIFVKKPVTIFNKIGQIATEKAFEGRIPPSQSTAFIAFGACNGKARLEISVTNNNTSNMVVRVKENGNGGPLLNTFTLGGPIKNFVKYIDSDKPLYIEITNTNPSIRKDIQAVVRYTNSSTPSLNLSN
jgi:hypothetical protein